jgi:uncharacterized protein (DUF2062 family)
VLRDNVRITLLNVKLVARRFLPWPHAKLVREPRRTIREQLRGLVHESNTPAALGVAVAVGCVVGTTPFFSVQTAIAILLAAVFRLNKLATVVGSFVTTPPFNVPIIWASVELGSLMLDGAVRPWPEKIDHAFARAVLLEWLVGGLVVGSALGVLFGFLTAWIVTRRRRAAANLQERETSRGSTRIDADQFN